MCHCTAGQRGGGGGGGRSAGPNAQTACLCAETGDLRPELRMCAAALEHIKDKAVAFLFRVEEGVLFTSCKKKKYF